MTLSQARKKLGKLSEGISDEQLQQEIDMASLFKDAFFHFLRTTNALDFLKNDKYTHSEDV